MTVALVQFSIEVLEYPLACGRKERMQEIMVTTVLQDLHRSSLAFFSVLEEERQWIMAALVQLFLGVLKGFPACVKKRGKR